MSKEKVNTGKNKAISSKNFSSNRIYPHATTAPGNVLQILVHEPAKADF